MINISDNIDKGFYDEKPNRFKEDLITAFDLVDSRKKDLLFSKAWKLGNKYMPAHHPLDETNLTRKHYHTVLYFFEELYELV